MATSEVKEITDMATWDAFVEQSPQGTIFSSSKWLEAIGQSYKVWGYFVNYNLVGGMANFDQLAPLTPFQGILVKPLLDVKYARQISIYNEVTKALIPYAPAEFYNHYTFQDIRPFEWAGWGVDIKYTFVVDLTDAESLWGNLEKQSRYEITSYKGMTSISSLEQFDELYAHTFKRKNIIRTASKELIGRVNNVVGLNLYGTSDGKAMVAMVKDTKRSYYILGASDGKGGSSYCLWRALTAEMKYSKECDLVGCNDEKIGLFKRGFGGRLQCYFGVKRGS